MNYSLEVGEVTITVNEVTLSSYSSFTPHGENRTREVTFQVSVFHKGQLISFEVADESTLITAIDKAKLFAEHYSAELGKKESPIIAKLKEYGFTEVKTGSGEDTHLISGREAGFSDEPL